MMGGNGDRRNGFNNSRPGGSNQAAKARYKVTLHVPKNNKTSNIIVPHPQNATILSLREAALARAAKVGFQLPTDCPDPSACLGEIDGGLLCDDDVLEDVIFDPATEGIWFVFTDHDSRDRTHDMSAAGTASSTQVLKPLDICIITPELAKTKNRLEDIPKLPRKFGITYKSTLQQLKDVIGKQYFGVNVVPGGLSGSHEHGDCNCLLARKLLRSGTRDHVSFVREGNVGTLTCDICFRKLSEPCPQCASANDDDDDDDDDDDYDEDVDGESGRMALRCGTYLKHVGCQHVFHQHCSEGVEKEQSCPVKNKPHTTRPLNREYVPVMGTNRFLVVVYGRSSIQKVPLPPLTFPESSASAATQGVSFAYVKNVLSTALGKQFDFTNKVAHIFGATSISHTNQDSQLIFEYSCVVSICSHTKHPISPGNTTSTGVPQITLYAHDPTATTTDVTQDTQSGPLGANSNPQLQGTPEIQYDIDIHTADAPIVCLDEHTELGELHLDDCAVGSVINLFVTLRSIDKTRKLSRPSVDDGEITGMDEMFMDRDHWRLQFIQSERGMATFLSSTRVFASKIEKAEPRIQNSVLALFMHLTHFPPILRSLHTLMTKKTLTPAESAVLVQCVYELTRELLTPGHLIENRKERVLEGSRLFYHLAMELSNRFQNDPAATEYLDAMKHVNLVDAETFQPLKDPITTNLGIIESAYFRALTEGLLGGLAPVISTSPNEAELRVLKLVKRTGGTMTAVTVFDSDTLQLALHERSHNLASIPDRPRSVMTTKGPRELNYNIQDLCQQSAVGTFAVVRPMSLRSQSVQVPTLSLDSEGLMAVYVGRPPCAPPDKDITIFRPTRGGAVDIDVSLVTQQLEPILKQRTEDRSVALDSLGEAETKLNKTPSEIIMLCVDGSTSMKSTAGFEGLNDDVDSDTDGSDVDNVCDSDSAAEDDDDAGEDPLQKAISILSAHENLQEIVSTIRTKMFNGQKEDVATRAVAVVISLYKAELEVFKAARLHQEANLTSRHLQSAAYRRGNPTVQRIKRLQGYVKCLSSVAVSGLVTFLTTQASKPTGSLQTSRPNQVDEHLAGSGIAGSTSLTSLTSTVESTRLEIPPTFQCPISYELFETPVVAEDGFTYDKTHIETWFRTTGTNNSPMTGLRMGTLLLPNRNLSTQIREWREGLDIIRAETQDNTPSRQVSRRGRGWGAMNSWRSSSPEMVKITMIMDTNHWDFRLPKKVRYDSLKALAFRCLKGETSAFTILHNGGPLLQENRLHGTSSAWIVTLKLGMTITIQKVSLPSGPASASPAVIRNTPPPEKVLVKVYRYSGTGHTAPAFTFWILKNTQRNVGSILFNYWTHNLGSFQTSPDRFKVWANARYVGDGQITATPLRIWQPLSEAIQQYMTEGTTESDPLYQKVVEDEFAVRVDMSSPISDEKKANVLKLLLVEQSNIRKSPKPSNIGKDLTRMDVMKQVFDNYINRTLAYDISNHIGLITFATKPSVKQNITGVIENLRNALGNLQCEGDTAMWDALKLAAECLKTYGAKYPEAKKRIVCLSDGEDTNSKAESWRLCMELQNDNIVVDSISIGMAHGGNGALRGISYGTGGYKFFPRDLESAVAICELETVLVQAERPEIPAPNQLLRLSRNPISEFRQYATRAVVDIVNEDVYPARKSHPNLQDKFIAISSTLEKGGNRAMRHNASATGFRLGDARLLQEMRLIASTSQPYYDVYASESNMRFWKVVMEAPPGSTYAGGVFLLYLDLDTSYPRSPPKARFVTPILHPNINKHGRVCHSILDRDWTSDTTLSALLNVIWSLLLVPNKNDFANVVMSLNYLWDEVGHQDRVRAHVQKHAIKTREQWRREIIGSE